MGADALAQASARVCATLVSSGEWQEAKCILLYAAMPDELETAPLIGFALAQGKQVLLPRVVGDEMELRFLNGSEGSLVKGAYGISEPGPDCALCEDYSVIDLAVIPGRAFTPEGKRLGRGKGFYDKFLSKLGSSKTMLTVGLALPCQIFQDLPTDPWDVSLDYILTSE